MFANIHIFLIITTLFLSSMMNIDLAASEGSYETRIAVTGVSSNGSSFAKEQAMALVFRKALDDIAEEYEIPQERVRDLSKGEIARGVARFSLENEEFTETEYRATVRVEFKEEFINSVLHKANDSNEIRQERRIIFYLGERVKLGRIIDITDKLPNFAYKLINIKTIYGTYNAAASLETLLDLIAKSNLSYKLYEDVVVIF